MRKEPQLQRGKWFVNRICLILKRAGLHKRRKNAPRVPKRYDPEAAQALARQLREEGLPLADWDEADEAEADAADVEGSGCPGQVSLLLQGTEATSALPSLCQ